MKMKKVLSLALAAVMALGSLSFASANPVTTTAVEAPAGLERIVENGYFGVSGLRLQDEAKREEFTAIILRLSGISDEEVLALKEKANFSDVPATDYMAPWIGKAVKDGLFMGDTGTTTFRPKDSVSYTEMLVVLMRALGYTATDFQGLTWPTGYVTKAAEVGLEVDLSVDPSAPVKRETVAYAMEQALDTKVKGGDTTLAQELGIEEVEVTPATLKVDEVVTNTAKSFLVKFNKAVEDTSKIEFAVKRGTAVASVKVVWNEAKTEATLESTSTKLAEGIYTITVTDKTEETAVELIKVDREITKEKVESVEFDSDVLVRISDEKGIVGYTVKNQYGENITDAALGRGLDWIVSTNGGYTRDSKAGVLEITHSGATFNQLKDLKTVVVTVRDTTTGFVQTKTFSVSDTVAVVNDIKLLGIVDEKGNEVDFTFDPTKAYYLDFEAFDANGKKIDYYAALNSKLYETRDANNVIIPNTGTKVLDVRSSNDSLVQVELEKHPDNSSKGVYRLVLQGTAGPSYDTPVSFMAMAPFSGKSSTMNVTLLRKARVESFSMQSPAETASVNKSIEIPFTALDNNGKEITRHEDLNGKITFSPAANLTFVRQANGSTKLFAKFPARGMQYITSTVNGSLTGSFSQISLDVKDTAVPTTIEPLKHARAYTEGATWGSRRVNNFVIKDQYDRTMNLRADASATAYTVKVTTTDANVVSVNNGTTATISGEQTVTFKGGSTFGTTTITYELFNGTTLVDSASTLVYNVEMKDVRDVKIVADHSNDLYMTTQTRNVDANMNNAFTMVGLLDSGMEVRINQSANGLNFTSTDARFVINGNKVFASGSFGTDTTATTTVTGYVYNQNGVLSASTEVKASSIAPIAKEVYVSYVNADRRAAVYTVDNDVIEVTQANLLGNKFNGASIFGFDRSTGNDPVTAATFQFWVNTQYGQDDTGLLTNVNVVKNTPAVAGTITVNPTTGVMTVSNDVAVGAEFTITAIANGVSKTITIVVK